LTRGDQRKGSVGRAPAAGGEHLAAAPLARPARAGAMSRPGISATSSQSSSGSLIANSNRRGRACLRTIGRSPNPSSISRRALALRQGVRGKGRAHLDVCDQDVAVTPEATNPLRGGIGVMRGVFGRKLRGDERAIGAPDDDIGGGAARVDPELPPVQGASSVALILPASCTESRQSRGKGSGTERVDQICS